MPVKGKQEVCIVWSVVVTSAVLLYKLVFDTGFILFSSWHVTYRLVYTRNVNLHCRYGSVGYCFPEHLKSSAGYKFALIYKRYSIIITACRLWNITLYICLVQLLGKKLDLMVNPLSPDQNVPN